MITVKKYSTFQDLKASEGKVLNYKMRIKKHNEFENFIKAISSIFNKKSTPDNSK